MNRRELIKAASLCATVLALKPASAEVHKVASVMRIPWYRTVRIDRLTWERYIGFTIHFECENGQVFVFEDENGWHFNPQTRELRIL